jgi:glycylpeptide N-tetradecanoyltransferase
MCEINFLCVHKKLRSKRLAPVLIKEVTRRVNLRGIFQAAYTAGVVLPKPVSACRYFHRSLNPRKLLDIKFTHLGPRMTVPRTEKLYKLDEVGRSHLMAPLAAQLFAAYCMSRRGFGCLSRCFESVHRSHLLL